LPEDPPTPEPGTDAAATWDGSAAEEGDQDYLRRLWRDPRAVLARRELRSLADEKTIVLALLIQLFVAAFSSFLVVGLVSMYQPGSVAGVSVDAAVTGEAADSLLETLDDQRGMQAQEYETSSAAMDAFQRGDVQVVFEAQRAADGGIQVLTTVPDANVRTTVVVVEVRKALRAFERAERTDRVEYLSNAPLALPGESASSPYFGFSYTVLVPLLLLLPAFIGGSVTVDSITEEIDRGTLELLRVAPLSPAAIVDGKLLASVLLAPAQAALWMALLDFNGTPVANLPTLLVLTTAFALAVSGLGAAVSLLTPDRRAAQFLYSTGVLALFGAATLLPGSPANTIARLAIDSADETVYATVGGYVLLAVAAYVGVRMVVDRVDMGALE
jgi:ABC-2 type transport system permease protein